MAMNATMVWRCQNTGSDSNGGGFDSSYGGVDRSTSDAAYQTLTDLVAVAGSTISSGTYTFVANDRGNIINTDAGRLVITAVSGGVATVDHAHGITADSSMGASCLFGGAMKSPGATQLAVNTANVAGMLVNLKKHSTSQYSASSTANVADGRISTSVMTRWSGFVTTPGDLSTATTLFSSNLPSIKATSNSMTLITVAANDCSFENIELDGDKANRSTTTGFTGNFRNRTINCRCKNMTAQGWVNSGFYNAAFCEAVSCGSIGFHASGTFYGCISRSNTTEGFRSNGSADCYINCVAYGNTTYGWGDGFSDAVHIGCIAYGNTSGGFYTNATNDNRLYVNCVSYGNTGLGWHTTAARSFPLLFNCAGGGNSANFNSTDIPVANRVGFITLTADPFTSASGFNYALNTTSGGGLLLRAAGFGNFPGSATFGYPDVGAVQNKDIFDRSQPIGSVPDVPVFFNNNSPLSGQRVLLYDSLTSKWTVTVSGWTSTITGSAGMYTFRITDGASIDAQDVFSWDGATLPIDMSAFTLTLPYLQQAAANIFGDCGTGCIDLY